ncbi:hypothetical protein HMPREF1408_00902 [Helicobacter pylori GAM245Ai]|nr:hypothetical protein HMPREF1408_00902 [Helicobacter pylori GAM245Ai]
MIDVNGLLKELDDALDKVVAKKEPESFLKADRLTNRGISKEY